MQCGKFLQTCGGGAKPYVKKTQNGNLLKTKCQSVMKTKNKMQLQNNCKITVFREIQCISVLIIPQPINQINSILMGRDFGEYVSCVGSWIGKMNIRFYFLYLYIQFSKWSNLSRQLIFRPVSFVFEGHLFKLKNSERKCFSLSIF